MDNKNQLEGQLKEMKKHLALLEKGKKPKSFESAYGGNLPKVEDVAETKVAALEKRYLILSRFRI